MVFRKPIWMCNIRKTYISSYIEESYVLTKSHFRVRNTFYSGQNETEGLMWKIHAWVAMWFSAKILI